MVSDVFTLILWFSSYLFSLICWWEWNWVFVSSLALWFINLFKFCSFFKVSEDGMLLQFSILISGFQCHLITVLFVYLAVMISFLFPVFLFWLSLLHVILFIWSLILKFMFVLWNFNFIFGFFFLEPNWFISRMHGYYLFLFFP